MDRLASCYFCGDAFDASLSEYPVVPRELQPAEGGPTVVLCGDCRGKLDAVVDEVVAATGDDAAAAGGQATATDTAGANGAEPADSPGGSLLGDGTQGETTTDVDEWASPASGDSADEGGEAMDEPPATADEGRATTDEEPTDARETPASADGDTAATTASAGDDGATDDGPTLTKLEYNKVIRLLKNRPFPVEKAEIREVATSAYDIDPAEFDAVIEAAVERDLIAVESGQFVDPA